MNLRKRGSKLQAGLQRLRPGVPKRCEDEASLTRTRNFRGKSRCSGRNSRSEPRNRGPDRVKRVSTQSRPASERAKCGHARPRWIADRCKSVSPEVDSDHDRRASRYEGRASVPRRRDRVSQRRMSPQALPRRAFVLHGRLWKRCRDIPTVVESGSRGHDGISERRNHRPGLGRRARCGKRRVRTCVSVSGIDRVGRSQLVTLDKPSVPPATPVVSAASNVVIADGSVVHRDRPSVSPVRIVFARVRRLLTDDC